MPGGILHVGVDFVLIVVKIVEHVICVQVDYGSEMGSVFTPINVRDLVKGLASNS